jgi:hypothetical protein
MEENDKMLWIGHMYLVTWSFKIGYKLSKEDTV